MKNAKREMKRKGFTLVELLIVIVVIGVLSAMMMLSSTEAVSSARASNIVSNLRNLKTAALEWYADHLDTAEDATKFGTNKTLNDYKQDILKYLNNADKDTGDYAHYSFAGNTTTSWFVYYSDAASMTTNISEKLAGRATTTGLLKDGTVPTKEKPNTYVAQTSSFTGPYMFIR